MVIEKPGFSTGRRFVELQGGQDVEDIEVILSSGDGEVSGLITTTSTEPPAVNGRLGGATIVEHYLESGVTF